MLNGIKRGARSLLSITGIRFRKTFWGQRIVYDPSTEIGWQLLAHGSFEEAEIKFCQSILKSDSVVVDIGANIGLHSIALGFVAKNGLVLSFEPSPRTYQQLCRNVEGMTSVVPINLALSSECKIARFFEAVDNAYSSLKDTGRKKVGRVLPVACVTGDLILEKVCGKKIDLIKIDVEGFESEVLTGLTDVISSSRPIVFCEIYQGEKSNSNPKLTIDFLIEKSYEAFVFSDGKLSRFVTHDDTKYNYFFVPIEKLKDFDAFNRT